MSLVYSSRHVAVYSTANAEQFLVVPHEDVPSRKLQFALLLFAASLAICCLVACRSCPAKQKTEDLRAINLRKLVRSECLRVMAILASSLFLRPSVSRMTEFLLPRSERF